MSASAERNDARLDFRLPSDLKRTIEQAAAQTGQSVSDFAVSVLVQTARDVLQQHNETRLSGRDRDLFVAMLDEADARPNDALVAAAKRYSEQID
jgi:uncharacterized protein (DUF1778 family)